ncbi:rhodanese-like domain-containing protein [Candidatus Pacearchaeota archaeon]|nr:rhodanese-like domain-containing protein [Candidatus Pacearchaeota archaeon]
MRALLFSLLVISLLFISACSSGGITTYTATQMQTVTQTISEINTITETTTLTPQPTVPNQIAQDLTVTEAYNMIQDNIDNPQFVILDVRGPDEHATSHIEGSALIDMGSDSWLATVEVLDKSYTYLIY